MASVAPVVLFVYNRPSHTRSTLNALANNHLAPSIPLIVYSDAARTVEDQAAVNAVRAVVGACQGFKSVTLIEREKNFGLARNISDGVSEAMHAHGKAVILEDDVITSRWFLTFMNDALERYKDEQRIWHISGWNYPIAVDGLGDAFFWRSMNCWGWASWSDRWQHFKKDPAGLIQRFDANTIKRFNLDGAYNVWWQVKENYVGRRNTWAVFWYATIFENDGLCLNPTVSLTTNIGLDGSGENCGTSFGHLANAFAEHQATDFPDEYVENELALKRIIAFHQSHDKVLPLRIANRIYNTVKRKLVSRK